jgi:hypothetical protein
MSNVTKPTLFLKNNSDENVYVTVSGLVMCFGIFMKHYKGLEFDAVVAGHFNTPSMYDSKTKTFTESGLKFLLKFKKYLISQNWDVEDIEVFIYYAEKTEGKTHENSDNIILSFKKFFKSLSINHFEIDLRKDDRGIYTFVF